MLRFKEKKTQANITHKLFFYFKTQVDVHTSMYNKKCVPEKLKKTKRNSQLATSAPEWNLGGLTCSSFFTLGFFLKKIKTFSLCVP